MRRAPTAGGRVDSGLGPGEAPAVGLLRRAWSLVSDRPPRAHLRGLAGRALVHLLPGKTRSVEADLYAPDRDNWELLIRAGLDHAFYAEKDPDRLRAAQRRYWGGDAGRRFHERAAGRFEAWFPEHAIPLADRVVALVAERPDLSTVCELGTGNGKLLAHLAPRLPPSVRCVGLDLSAEQVAANQRAHPGLEFVAADLNEWIPRAAPKGTVFVSYAGVLEYLTRPDLERLASSLVALHPSALVLLEPIVGAHDVDRDHRSLPAGELSFSHPYAHVLARAGLTLRSSEIIPFTDGRFVRVVAVS